jgi:hypothetical protein
MVTGFGVYDLHGVFDLHSKAMIVMRKCTWTCRIQACKARTSLGAAKGSRFELQLKNAITAPIPQLLCFS